MQTHYCKVTKKGCVRFRGEVYRVDMRFAGQRIEFWVNWDGEIFACIKVDDLFHERIELTPTLNAEKNNGDQERDYGVILM